VGIVLAAYALATAAFAAVSRSRSLERVEAARRLAQSESARRSSERLAAAGALAAGLAHEVRSPLNAIGLAAQRLERKLDGSGDELVLAGRIRVEVRRLEGVLREFLDLARPVGDERRSVALGALCTEVLDLLRPEAEQRGVRLDAVDGEAWVRVDSGSVRRALINLVRNAIAASPRAGRVRVVVERVDGRGFAHVLDEGPGVDGDVAGRVFEPFVTTRADGAGLGLSLVKRVAEEHGGSCSLVSRPGGGAEACLGLPADGGAEG
jgi:two-component system sensor histidine kinase HydH